MGTSGWSAPEIFERGGYGSSADVFSFGVLVWDMLSGGAGNPLAGIEPSRYVARLRSGERPPIPAGGRGSGVAAIAAACWRFEPEERPAAVSILELLQPVFREARETAPVNLTI